MPLLYFTLYTINLLSLDKLHFITKTSDPRRLTVYLSDRLMKILPTRRALQSYFKSNIMDQTFILVDSLHAEYLLPTNRRKKRKSTTPTTRNQLEIDEPVETGALCHLKSSIHPRPTGEYFETEHTSGGRIVTIYNRVLPASKHPSSEQQTTFCNFPFMHVLFKRN